MQRRTHKHVNKSDSMTEYTHINIKGGYQWRDGQSDDEKRTKNPHADQADRSDWVKHKGGGVRPDRQEGRRTEERGEMGG